MRRNIERGSLSAYKRCLQSCKASRVMVVTQAKVGVIPQMNMFIYLLLIGSAFSAPADEVESLINQAELTLNDDTFLLHIVPSSLLMKLQKKSYNLLADIVGEDNDKYKQFMSHKEKGHTLKGLTFNIYDDNMRDATIALFYLLRDIEPKNMKRVKEWAAQNINDHMFDYAERLYWLFGLYSNDFGRSAQEPPFLVKPNFFVNAETVIKALKIRNSINNFHYQSAKSNQFYRTDDIISVNTNYSNWNTKDCDERLDYFTEDISLNSYYYGIQLLHPYWMSNDVLDSINPKHTEQYYFRHRQLLARFQLEYENIRQRNATRSEICDEYFNSNLIYDNGLPFPVRSNIQGDWTEDRAKMKSIDIALRECISRGLIVMENGTTITLSKDNYVDLITKLVRANYDGLKTAKIVRSLYGYGRNGYPTDIYNPAPSLLHQPETTLRDPGFWTLLPYLLRYFSEYQSTLEPFDLSQYETDKFTITENNFSKLTTYFEYYQFIMDKALQSSNDFPVSFAARQKRLNFLPFSLNFTIMSKIKSDVIVRLFLGPQCKEEDCWDIYDKFYQIDSYIDHIDSGENVLTWSPSTTDRFSSDEVFNKEHSSSSSECYNMFKFPQNLLLPKGLEEGLNLTLFIIITQVDDSQQQHILEGSTNYDFLSFEIEDKPIGFPFHRQSMLYKAAANNYRFYNVSIFHKKRPVDDSGYFSPHLY